MKILNKMDKLNEQQKNNIFKKRKIFEKVPEKLDEIVPIKSDQTTIEYESITISKKEYEEIKNDLIHYKNLVASMSQIETISNSLIKIFKEKIIKKEEEIEILKNK